VGPARDPPSSVGAVLARPLGAEGRTDRPRRGGEAVHEKSGPRETRTAVPITALPYAEGVQVETRRVKQVHMTWGRGAARHGPRRSERQFGPCCTYGPLLILTIGTCYSCRNHQPLVTSARLLPKEQGATHPRSCGGGCRHRVVGVQCVC
jgi:hypothetical protein